MIYIRKTNDPIIMSTLSSYLASKYLSADPKSTKPSKKRKRKGTEQEGLIIADDDDNSWAKSTEKDNDDDPLVSSTGSAEFRKSKKSAWKTVGVPAMKSKVQDTESASADLIIAQVAQENAEKGDDDDAPVVENIVKMTDGTHAGLQSGAAVAAQMAQRKREEEAEWKEEERRLRREGKKLGAEETVYRDATGRRIDISMKRAEARREAEEKARKEREEKENAKGDVQREAAVKRREELEDAIFMPLARTIDDEDMNRELKERDRWNDPAAMFLTEKRQTDGVKSRTTAGTKKLYTGAAQPNRYGIRPGWRWDGVDRSNGWEGERFKAINRKVRNKDLDFAWQMDT